jgi:hypothetical protein
VSTSRRKQGVLAGLAVAVAGALAAGVVTFPAGASELPNLPQSAGGMQQAFSPAYDYDTDGCYAVAAIAPDGTINEGLNNTGAVNGNCHDAPDLDRSQTYSRSKCNNGWCAIAYASYFEKDQNVNGPGNSGHRHDWEHVVSYVNQNSNQVEFVCFTKHSGITVSSRNDLRFDGTHPKAVYHKDGAFNTHFFRAANDNDEPPENDKHVWLYPPLIDYDSWPSTELRDKLFSADFGDATLKITDDRFNGLLSQCKTELPNVGLDPNA